MNRGRTDGPRGRTQRAVCPAAELVTGRPAAGVGPQRGAIVEATSMQTSLLSMLRGSTAAAENTGDRSPRLHHRHCCGEHVCNQHTEDGGLSVTSVVRHPDSSPLVPATDLLPCQLP